MNIAAKELSLPSGCRTPISPSAFDTFIIEVQVRTDPSRGLTDDPSYTFQLPIPLLLYNIYKYIPSKKIRLSHLSWDKFYVTIARKYRFELDLRKYKLRFTTGSAVKGLSNEYFKISSELTF